MPKSQKSNTPPKIEEKPQPELPLSDQAVTFLTQECERMLSLYSQAHSNVQSVFNFYLTFATTVVGGVIVLIQLAPEQLELFLIAVFFFSFIVGSVYLSALSGQYAHAARYANAIDEIRRFLIQRMNVSTPPVYAQFLTPTVRVRKDSPLVWLYPSGTYQLFIALVNSLSLAGLVLVIFSDANAGLGRGFVAAVLVFIISLTIYNVYSRLAIRAFHKRLHVRVDRGGDLTVWAAGE